jgi:hypothetical protein
MIERITHYGGPKDEYVRVVEEFRVREGILDRNIATMEKKFKRAIYGAVLAAILVGVSHFAKRTVYPRPAGDVPVIGRCACLACVGPS